MSQGEPPPPTHLLLSLPTLKEKKRERDGKKSKKKDAISTRCSQVVSLPSTDRAQCCLASVIGREPAHSAWYGRWQEESFYNTIYTRLRDS